MKILLLSQNWFQHELQAAGHTVISCGADIHFDVRIPIPQLTIEEVYQLVGFEPDLLIAYDNSIPLFITGLERVHCPIIYYAVDVHHHIDWQRFLPSFFDAVLVAQKDYVAQFIDTNGTTHWFPLWASRYVEPSSAKVRQAVFVGTMNPDLNPERVTFLEALQQKVPLECMMGEYWKIFPESTVVLNQTVKGDLNFRVFEALMSGSALVTEDTSNGLKDLFTPDVHLSLYERNNVDDAAEKIHALLGDPSKRALIETAGRDIVVSHHTTQARATKLLEIIGSITAGPKRSVLPLLANFCALANYFEGARSVRAVGEALRVLELGLSCGERLDSLTAPIAHSLCSFAKTTTYGVKASQLLETVTREYPEFLAE